MDYVDIGGIRSSRLILGCMRIADKPIENVERLINVALDSGINTVDHADIYGGGKCESIYGELFKRDPSLRDKLVIQTKCGIRGGWYDLSATHIQESVNASLKRLNTDRIDILLLHRPDTLMKPDEIARAFDDLTKSGKVRAFGVSNFSAAQTDYLQSFCDNKLYVNQIRLSPVFCPAIERGLNVNTEGSASFDRDGDFLFYARKNGVTIQTYGTMQCEFADDNGFLYSGAFTTDLAKTKYFALNFLLDGLAQKYGVTKEAVAVKWVLYHPANMQALIGTTLAKRLEAYRDCCDVPLNCYEWYKIYEAAGHKII